LLADQLDIDMVLYPSLSEASAEIKRIQPQIAIIDATLCDHLGGVGAVRAVRVLAPACDVILQSIDPTSPEGLEAIRAGAFECMSSAASIGRVKTALVRARSGLQRTEHALHELEQALGLDRPRSTLECSWS
jgi:DNA-binding NtrC family response regulator